MLQRLLIALIRIYQRVLSPLKMHPTCRFVPTCSSYAIAAINEWGAVVGCALALWRILRCNPFCCGGIDPVPKRVVCPQLCRTNISVRNADKYLSMFPASYRVLFPPVSKDTDSLTVEK